MEIFANGENVLSEQITINRRDRELIFDFKILVSVAQPTKRDDRQPWYLSLGTRP